MTRSILAVTLALGLAPADLRAGQPYSESLVDCAALFTMVLRWDTDTGSPEKRRRMRAVGDTLLDGAVVQARAEGKADPVAHVDALFEKKAAVWDERGVLFILSEEFREWASYCRKFSGHLGIDLRAAMAE